VHVAGVLVAALLAPTGFVVAVGQLVELGHLVMMTPDRRSARATAVSALEYSDSRVGSPRCEGRDFLRRGMSVVCRG
jgi:hypothetical protein